MATIKNYLRQILPQNFILWSHKLKGILAAIFYRFPARKLKVIGVTGTNGKTTTCHLITQILEGAGYKVGMATTVDFKIGHRVWPNLTKMTTLSPFALQSLLASMAKTKCDFAVLETTSHAISQYRIYGIPYKGIVLTNLSHDHFDYHGTFEEYRATKGQLFANNPSVHVVNLDDKSADYFLKFKADKKISYGLTNKSLVYARKVLPSPSGTLFTLVAPTGQIAIDLPLPGRFNLYNALAAAALTFGLGMDLDLIKKALENAQPVVGRMEKIDLGQNFYVYVDYAHTPDALEKIYQAINPLRQGHIIHVFGATGDRDKTKRPIMGAIAGRFADYVIITNEDPYSEDPLLIMDQVAKGVPRGAAKQTPKIEGKNFWKILDRKEAIAKALNIAQKGDLVLITGKGAEEFMVVGEEKVPFSDRKVAKELLEDRLKRRKIAGGRLGVKK